MIDLGFEIDIAFAKLELLELRCGRRTLTQCPGLKAIGRRIREAETDAATTSDMVAELPGT